MRFVVHFHPSRRSIIALAMTTSCVLASAQTKCVIIDKETGTPIRDVKVRTDKGHVAVSDYQGRVVIDSAFNSATISHVSYLQRIVNRHECRDTLWLLPKENRLGEVVVWGKEQKNIKTMIGLATRDAAAYAPSGGVVSFDFFEMFRKKPLSKKARRQNEKLLRDWDKVYRDPNLGATPRSSQDTLTVK